MIQAALTSLFPELCLHCGEKISSTEFFCTECAGDTLLKRPDNIPETQIPRKFSFLYDGPGKALFAAAKFSERKRVVNFLIREAREDLASLIAPNTFFLIVPSRRIFLRRIISACLPREKIIWDAFRITSKGRKEANKFLGEAGRYRRIHESLLWNSPNLSAGVNYVICDDVSTTGATLNHAAHLVEQNLGVEKRQITLWALMYRERHFLIPRQ